MLEVCRFDPAMNCFLCEVLRFWLVLVEDFRHLKPGVTATPTDIDLEAKSLSGIRCCFCLLLAKSKACCVFSYFSARNLRVRHGCIPACFYWFYCFDLLSSSILTQSMVHVPDRPVTACTRKTLKMSSFESSSWTMSWFRFEFTLGHMAVQRIEGDGWGW